MAFNVFKKEKTPAETDAKKIKKEKNASEKPLEAKTPKVKKIDLAWRILKTAHITEKATDLSEKNQYIFNVYPGTNKNEVKKAVENIYGVDVVSVNVINIPSKKRRVGKTLGWKSGYKKAIVSVKEGQKIELMPR